MGTRAVIFDFDGVIADSWDVHERCWQAALKKYKLTVPEETLVKSVGLSSIQTAELLREELGPKVPAAELSAVKEASFARRAKDLQMIPGIDDALIRLRTDFTIAVTSLRERLVVEQALERFGLQELPELVVAISDVADAVKMDEVLLATAKEIGVPVERCALVDDARNGVLAAKRVGMNAIALNSNPKHDIDFTMADAQIGTLDELVPALVNQVIAA